MIYKLLLIGILFLGCNCSSQKPNPLLPLPTAQVTSSSATSVTESLPSPPPPVVIEVPKINGRVVSGPAWSMVLPHSFKDRASPPGFEFFSLDDEVLSVAVSLLSKELRSQEAVIADTEAYFIKTNITVLMRESLIVNGVTFSIFVTMRDTYETIEAVAYADTSVAISCGAYNITSAQQLRCYDIISTVKLH